MASSILSVKLKPFTIVVNAILELDIKSDNVQLAMLAYMPRNIHFLVNYTSTKVVV